MHNSPIYFSSTTDMSLPKKRNVNRSFSIHSQAGLKAARKLAEKAHTSNLFMMLTPTGIVMEATPKVAQVMQQVRSHRRFGPLLENAFKEDSITLSRAAGSTASDNDNSNSGDQDEDDDDSETAPKKAKIPDFLPAKLK